MMKTKILILILSAILFSCSGKYQRTEKQLFFPAAPDEPKIQFLTTISNSTDVTGGRSFFENYVLGEESPQMIAKPYGICSSKNLLLVVDTKSEALIKIDFQEKTFGYIIPNGRGTLKKPLNCFIYDSLFYINDIASKDIVILDYNGDFIDRFGSDILLKPSDIFVYQNKIYVSDMETNKIYIFDKQNHKLINSFPNGGVDSEEFLHSPTHLTIQNDKLYVCDFGEFNIKEFSTSGNFIKKIGNYGKNLGEFVRPKGIAADNANNLFVTDAAFENTQIFDNNGKLLMFFGGPYTGPGFLNLPIRINIDYENVSFFENYVDNAYNIKYLIYVTNQFGPDKITVYGFLEKK